MTDSPSNPQLDNWEQKNISQVDISVAMDFKNIYEAEVSYVWNCLRRLGVNERDLEDKVQDMFVIVYKKLNDYDSTRPIRPWLAGIAVRVASDYRKSAYQKREVLQKEFEAIDENPNPEIAFEGKQARDLVIDALDRLDIDRRTVFVLHEIDGYPIPQIAQMVDIPLNTLYSRLRLAREQFSDAVKRLSQKGGKR